MTIEVRDANEADLPAILAIHNHAIENSTANFSFHTVDLEDRRAYLAERRRRGFPVLVAEENGEVLGFASFGDYRPHDGYFKTVEHSIYVDLPYQRQGVATELLLRLIEEAQVLGKHVMVGGIAADNLGSIALHARHGFVETGRMPEVGFKFGRYLDLVLMQRNLD